MWIEQDRYLENAKKNYNEWFIDNDYDVIFIPLVARDYLTAYLMKYQNISKVAPDIDWVFNELIKYDKDILLFNELDIRLKDDIKDKEYYLNLLSDCKEYVESRLCQ